MNQQIEIDILAQPDDTLCGPTCLHAIYRYYGEALALDPVIDEVRRLDTGGTLAVFLGCHALQRGYRARIYTCNLQVFDPTWFAAGKVDLAERLRLQARHKSLPKLTAATEGYLEFLGRGGEIRLTDLSSGLLKKYLYRSVPVLTGLSATYLYQSAREYGPTNDHDDVRGEPVGHFVVLCAYHKKRRRIMVADPLQPNPLSDDRYYYVGVNRVIHAILLGIVTYDANLLVIEPAPGSA